MRDRRHRGRPHTPRRGAATAELALLLPVVAFLFVAVIDFARVFHYYVIVTSCARNGALYGCLDASHSTDTTGIQKAALGQYNGATSSPEVSSLSPTPSVSSTTGTDASRNAYVKVTVTYTFNTISGYPWISSTVTVGRTVQMRVAPGTAS